MPDLLDVNEIGEKKISLTVRKHETLRCYYSFTNGIKLQTRISYRSKWDYYQNDVSIFFLKILEFTSTNYLRIS